MNRGHKTPLQDLNAHDFQGKRIEKAHNLHTAFRTHLPNSKHQEDKASGQLLCFLPHSFEHISQCQKFDLILKWKDTRRE